MADKHFTIPAGGSHSLNGNGQTYLFCKAADRDVAVEIAGERVVMRSGSYQEFDPLVDQNARVTFYNPDTENPAVVTFVMGRGTYDEKIVRGQITTRLGILSADGGYMDDTRKTVTLNAISVAGTGITEDEWELVKTIWTDSYPWRFSVEGGTFEDPTKKGFSYNPDVHQGIMVFGQRTDNGYHLIEIDPYAKTLIADWGPVANLGQPQAATRYGSTLYQNNSFNTPGVYKKTFGGNWELLYPGNFTGTITVDKDGNIYSNITGTVYKIDPQGNLIKTAGVGTNVTSMAWHDGNLWVFGDGNYKGKAYNTDLELVYESVGTMRDNYATAIYNGYALTVVDSFPNYPIEVRALETVVGALAGRAYLACENAWLGPRPENLNAVRTSANVTVKDGDTGTPTVAGELIKLALEWYTGKKMPVDYMDLLHAVRITGGTNIDGFNYRPVEIQSNGQTLLAAKIPDDFTQVFPMTMQLTVDKRFAEYEPV